MGSLLKEGVCAYAPATNQLMMTSLPDCSCIRRRPGGEAALLLDRLHRADVPAARTEPKRLQHASEGEDLRQERFLHTRRNRHRQGEWATRSTSGSVSA